MPNKERRKKYKKSPVWLLDFKFNIYSQKGEDGIIEEILKNLPKNNRWCVEFGAWDGIFLSNTRKLIESKDYSAILIEASKTKFRDLQRNYSHDPKVIAINSFVGWRDEDNLDQILKDTPIPVDFDFLSIDIDGNDYHVWEAMSKYKPKVICIEFNPTIPTEIRFVQPSDPSVNQGASLLSLVELGKKKNYELVSVLPHNAFFVRSEYYPLFQIEDNSPEILRVYLDAITYLFIGFDGKVFLRGSKKLPWHRGIELKDSQIQAIPTFLRRYSGNYNKAEKIMFAIFLLFSNPSVFSRGASRRLRRRFKL